jgi:hypothetical protein
MRLQHVLIYLLPSSGGSLTRSSTPAGARGRPRSIGRWIAAAARGTRHGGVQCNVQGMGGAWREARAMVRGMRCGAGRLVLSEKGRMP